MQAEALTIPLMSSIGPEEASLWTMEPREFVSSLISLGSLESYGLSTTGFNEPLVEASAPAAMETHPLTTPMEAPALATEPPGEAPQVIAPPDTKPVLERLPVIVPGIAGGRAKPAQVFGAAEFTDKTIQVPPPSGLPLRPLMVLGPAESPDPPATRKKSKSDVRILPPAAVAVKASVPVETPVQPLSTEPAPDPAEPSLEPRRNAGASHMPKILVAAAAIAALGLGIFFFLGHGDTRPKPTVATKTGSADWISNFAGDTQNQRRVSVLRSSLGQTSYRLDFESSIQIKGLGWVYRAQDARNYYVSKIELERPGQNPEFAIVHYAVIDGVDQAHAQTPLHVGVPLGGHYKIRFEAAGDRFTTWVQDQQVDQWTDGRLKSGGAGLYREGAEQFTLHGDFQVTPLAK